MRRGYTGESGSTVSTDSVHPVLSKDMIWSVTRKCLIGAPAQWSWFSRLAPSQLVVHHSF